MIFKDVCKMKVTISKKEFNLLLKSKERKLVKSCYDCPIFNLEAKKKFRCKQIIYQLCGKEPVNCVEAIKLLRNFLNKFKQNKI